MRKILRILITSASIVCLLASLFLSGCTRHPNEEQLNTLEETKKAALAAEDELAKKQQEKADLENELAEKKQKLEDTQQEKEAVKTRLSGAE
jgi:septal ring factor EnvC (AmiA/AmiB activator)